MNIYVTIILVTFVNVVSCRDFYVGMFKKNDLLVAQDRLYKNRVPYKHMYAKYGRIFNCKITYYRISDRLGYGPGPKVEIVRGGLNRKYLALRLTSPYNMPISVNIYVGCANTFTTTEVTTHSSTTESKLNITEHVTTTSNNPVEVTTVGGCTHNCTNVTQSTAKTVANVTTAVPTTVK